jgi:2-phospho-L-lactate guanylyltransferase (CobY/MobA/RfbA family)
VFTPSRSGLGTNGVLLRPPAVMPLTFGEPSFDNHLAAARALRLAPRVVRLPGLGLDVDDPDDLSALLATGGHTESARLVAGWRVLERTATGPR